MNRSFSASYRGCELSDSKFSLSFSFPVILIFFLFIFIFSVCIGPATAQDKPCCNDPFRLELKLLPSGDSVLVLPLQKKELFGIRYIHSVDIKPVFEIFEVSPEGKLLLKDTYFRMFGAGMGYITGRGKLGYSDNWLWIKDINDPVNGFILRVGSRRVAHTLLYRGREINLSSLWAGERIQFLLKPNEWCKLR